MLKTHFGDVLHDDHEEEVEPMEQMDDLDPRDMDQHVDQHPVPFESRQTMIRKQSKVLLVHSVFLDIWQNVGNVTCLVVA